MTVNRNSCNRRKQKRFNKQFVIKHTQFAKAHINDHGKLARTTEWSTVPKRSGGRQLCVPKKLSASERQGSTKGPRVLLENHGKANEEWHDWRRSVPDRRRGKILHFAQKTPVKSRRSDLDFFSPLAPDTPASRGSAYTPSSRGSRASAFTPVTMQSLEDDTPQPPTPVSMHWSAEGTPWLKETPTPIVRVKRRGTARHGRKSKRRIEDRFAQDDPVQQGLFHPSPVVGKKGKQPKTHDYMNKRFLERPNQQQEPRGELYYDPDGVWLMDPSFDPKPKHIPYRKTLASTRRRRPTAGVPPTRLNL